MDNNKERSKIGKCSLWSTINFKGVLYRKSPVMSTAGQQLE
jgi:hypothetical protein